jgi:hypothetical protein
MQFHTYHILWCNMVTGIVHQIMKLRINTEFNFTNTVIISKYFLLYIDLKCVPATFLFHAITKIKNKAIPVTGRGALQGCEMLRIRHCIDNRLIDGGKVVSPTHRSHFTLQKHYFFNVSCTDFC